MSLLDDFARSCVLMEKKRVPDGAGGYCHGDRAIAEENARGGSVHEVTHWMPLPDLPKEE